MGTSNERLNFQVGGLQTLSQAGNVLTGINQTLELIGRAFDLAATAAKTFIATGSQFEQYNVQFETLLHSAELAQQRVSELVKFAAATPFEIPGIIETAKVLQAYEIYSVRALTAVGDMAAGMSMEMKEVGLALGAAATGEMERLKMLGITSATVTAHLGHEIMRGTTEGLQELSQAVIELFEIRAAGGMERASKTLVGILSMLADKWIAFKTIVADASAFQTVKEILGTMLEIVNDFFKAGEAEKFGQVVGQTLANVMWDVVETLAKVADALIWLVGKLGWAPVAVSETEAKSIELAAKRDELARLKSLRADLQAEGMQPEVYTLFDSPLGRALGLSKGPLKALEDKITKLELWLMEMPGKGIYGAIHQRRLEYERNIGATVGPFPEWAAQAEVLAPATAAAGAAPGPMTGAGWGVTGTGTEPPEEQMEGLREIQQRYLGILQGNWSNYYNAISGMSQIWARREGKVFRDLYKASRSFLAATLSDLIRMKIDEASLKQKMAAADALAAGANFMSWAVIKHVAAANAYAAIGGAASGLVEGFIGGENPYAAGIGVGGDTPGGTEPADGTRTLSRQVGIKTQSLIFNTYFVFHGMAYFGAGGMDELVDEHLVPALSDRIEMGALPI